MELSFSFQNKSGKLGFDAFRRNPTHRFQLNIIPAAFVFRIYNDFKRKSKNVKVRLIIFMYFIKCSFEKRNP